LISANNLAQAQEQNSPEDHRQSASKGVDIYASAFSGAVHRWLRVWAEMKVRSKWPDVA